MPDEIVAAANPRKTDGLEIHAVASQVAVYETQADRMHYLNSTAALILELCDGSHPVEEITDLLKEAFGLSYSPVQEVNSCIATLKKSGIVL